MALVRMYLEKQPGLDSEGPTLGRLCFDPEEGTRYGKTVVMVEVVVSEDIVVVTALVDV